jgi:hypothetical protein
MLSIYQLWHNQVLGLTRQHEKDRIIQITDVIKYYPGSL